MNAPERAAEGKAARSEVRRSSRSTWGPPEGRTGPVPIRYGRIAAEAI